MTPIPPSHRAAHPVTKRSTRPIFIPERQRLLGPPFSSPRYANRLDHLHAFMAWITVSQLRNVVTAQRGNAGSTRSLGVIDLVRAKLLVWFIPAEPCF